MPFRHGPELAPAVDEARALRAAFAHGASRGVGVADAPAVEDALAAFDRVANGTPWTEAGGPHASSWLWLGPRR